MIRLLAVIRSIVYATGFILLWWWLVMTVRPYDSRFHIAIPPFLRFSGLVLVVIGVAVALWCIGTFALVGKGTPAPFDAPRQFVVVGPYRYVRNPMYVGALAVVVGVGLWLQSISAFAVGVFFLLMANLFVLVYEEPTLERRFGERYLEYKRSVNRWLPSKALRDK